MAEHQTTDAAGQSKGFPAKLQDGKGSISETCGLPQTTPPPPLQYDLQGRRFSHCQAGEDDCDYEHCPRWRDGKIVNEAHCALDLIGRDEDE